MQTRYLVGLAVLVILLAAGAYYYVEKVNTKVLLTNNGAMPCSVFCATSEGQLPPAWKGAKAVGQTFNGKPQPVTNGPGANAGTVTCSCRRSDSTPYLDNGQHFSPWVPAGPACPPAFCVTGAGTNVPALAPAS